MTQESPATDTQSQTTNVKTAAQALREQRNEREKSHEFVLPSIGLTVHLRRPSVTTLIASGRVPDALASKLINIDTSSTRDKKATASDLTTMTELQKVIAKEALVSPKVVDSDANIDNDEIELADLDEEDLTAIMTFVTEGVQADKNATTFRNDG